MALFFGHHNLEDWIKKVNNRFSVLNLIRIAVQWKHTQVSSVTQGLIYFQTTHLEWLRLKRLQTL